MIQQQLKLITLYFKVANLILTKLDTTYIHEVQVAFGNFSYIHYHFKDNGWQWRSQIFSIGGAQQCVVTTPWPLVARRGGCRRGIRFLKRRRL